MWRDRIERTTQRKRERPTEVIDTALHAVGVAVSDRTCNLMPPIIDAMASGVTVGEIADAMRAGYGTRFAGSPRPAR